MSRLILYTGKGGVGKTTVAAATAILSSKKKKKTLLISTDPAHSLRDIFEKDIGPEPIELTKNLFVQEVDVYYSIEKNWGKLKEYLKSLLSWRGVDELIAEELCIFPGMEEVASFLWVHDHFKKGKYDVIIIDSAPTGETLRFLSLPDVGKWWMEKFFPVHRKVAHVLRPAIKMVSDLPFPEDETYGAAEELFYKLEEIKNVLSNPLSSSIRLVVNPEKMVIKETQRTFTYLYLYGYPIDLIVLNRVISTDDGYFCRWKNIHSKYRKLVEEIFSPIPILEAPFLNEEIIGMEKVEGLGRKLFGEKDPSDIFYKGLPFEMRSEGGKLYLILNLPFARKEEITILQRGEELTIHLGEIRRNIFLPRSFLSYSASEATLRGEKLTIRFEKRN